MAPSSQASASSLSDDVKVARYGAHTDFQGFTILRPDPRDWTTDGSGGLEVLHAGTGTWLPVALPPSSEIQSRLRRGDDTQNPGPGYCQAPASDFALVVNAGDLIQRWTNDRWLSAVHRVSPRGDAVVAAATDSTSAPESAPSSTSASTPLPQRVTLSAGRKAVVFFSGPRDDALVAVLPMRRVMTGAGAGAGSDEEDVVAAKYEPIRSGDHLQLKLRQMQPASHASVG